MQEDKELLLRGAGNSLQSGAVATHYKVHELLQSGTVRRPNVNHFLPSPIPLICILGTKTNGNTCLQTEPLWFESRIV